MQISQWEQNTLLKLSEGRSFEDEVRSGRLSYHTRLKIVRELDRRIAADLATLKELRRSLNEGQDSAHYEGVYYRIAWFRKLRKRMVVGGRKANGF